MGFPRRATGSWRLARGRRVGRSRNVTWPSPCGPKCSVRRGGGGSAASSGRRWYPVGPVMTRASVNAVGTALTGWLGPANSCRAGGPSSPVRARGRGRNARGLPSGSYVPRVGAAHRPGTGPRGPVSLLASWSVTRLRARPWPHQAARKVPQQARMLVDAPGSTARKYRNRAGFRGTGAHAAGRWPAAMHGRGCAAC